MWTLVADEADLGGGKRMGLEWLCGLTYLKLRLPVVTCLLYGPDVVCCLSRVCAHAGPWQGWQAATAGTGVLQGTFSIQSNTMNVATVVASGGVGRWGWGLGSVALLLAVMAANQGEAKAGTDSPVGSSMSYSCQGQRLHV